ncbi:MAG: type II CAAX endopeptidase family protein [Propionibacteriaceae bacterium]|nr:type II CAAX endopeptidase family protein [Propionibacteriaceae bacterium]
MQGQAPELLLIGPVVGLGISLVLPSGIALAVLGIVALFRKPEELSTYITDALAYRFPEGVLAAHLGLAAMIIVVWQFMRHVHHLGLRWTASVQPGMRWRYLVICVLAAAIVLNLVLWVGPEGRNMSWQEAQPQWCAYLAIVAIGSPLQAAAEEVFFRGYLQQTIGSVTGRAWVGVVVASLVFAFMHGGQNSALFVHRLGFGLIAGWLVVATGGLEAAIAVHIVNNLMAFGYAVFTGGVAALTAVRAISWTAAIAALTGFGLCALLAWWIGRRMNLATTTP